MILFGLYTGQRLGDIATLRWSNADLLHDELRLVTRPGPRRRTGRAEADFRDGTPSVVPSDSSPSSRRAETG